MEYNWAARLLKVIRKNEASSQKALLDTVDRLYEINKHLDQAPSFLATSRHS